LTAGIALNLPATQLFMNVYALDEYAVSHPEVFVWPGHELVIEPAFEGLP